MHALVRRIDSQVVAQAAPERGDQFVSLLAVHLPHSADVSCEMSLFHESGDDRLAKARWLAVHDIARSNEGPHEWRRHHGVAEPKSWKKRLVEGSDVDDTLSFIEALERSEWPAAVSEFTGVVVFDNPGARTSRAQARSSRRRAIDRATPFGNWCEDVMKTARAFGARRMPSVTLTPCWSTGIGQAFAPAATSARRVKE